MFGRRRENLPRSWKVRVPQDMLERIKKLLLSSSIEEGGKLLGRVSSTDNGSTIEVETYIDSGPGVSQSAAHLMPDGAYQEAIFRVIESFDAEIEHIGSWHSHHCNGLDVLSQGDVHGYKQSVNSADYNLDVFLALLVTQVTRRGLRARYFVFQRGEERYQEVPSECVEVYGQGSQFDGVLRTAEELALSHRGRAAVGGTGESRRREEDDLALIRAEDRRWFKENFENARSVRSTRDGSIRWRWSIQGAGGVVEFCLQYPTTLRRGRRGRATLESWVGGRRVRVSKVELGEERFAVLAREVRRATALAAD